jgi:hypothetical protein
MITRKLTFHADPSHGWLEVPATDILALHIIPSHYSHMHGDKVYLEEDCDFSLWLEAKRDAGEEFDLTEHHTNNDSIVRSFRGYA